MKQFISSIKNEKRNGIETFAELGKRTICITLAVCVSGCGASLMIKAQLGMNAYDALTVSFSELYRLPIGTVSIILNSVFFLMQVGLLGRKIEISRFLQLPIIVVLGSTINFMTYNVLQNLMSVHYVFRLFWFLCGLLLCAVACSILMKYHVAFPPESFCQVLSQISRLRFSWLRQGLDVICLLLILVLAYVFSTSINIREGTILSMLLFGPCIDMIINSGGKQDRVRWIKKF